MQPAAGAIGRMKEKLLHFWNTISLRNIWEEQGEDDWEDYDLREQYVSGADDLEDEDARAGIGPGFVYLIILALIIIAIVSYHWMSRRHLYTGYSVTTAFPGEDISGTRYEKLGSGFVKYGSDGVTYVNGKNETKWSAAHAIETPVTTTCGNTMVLYEQQGYTVEVIDTDGVIGSYTTDLPIMRAENAANGVCALMLKDGADSLIRLVSTDGTALAEVKTTLEDRGFPLAMDLSADGQDLMVSMVQIGAGTVDSTVAFYNFSSAAAAGDSHLVNSINYSGEVFPTVFYVSGRLAAAVSDTGFVTYSLSGKLPSQHTRVTLDQEILSEFHDGSHIGFVTASDLPDERYKIQVYRYSGKKTGENTFADGYTDARIDSGEILLYDTGHMMAFTKGGTARLNSDCDMQVSSFVKIPGFRKYAVLTNSGIYRVRAE